MYGAPRFTFARQSRHMLVFNSNIYWYEEEYYAAKYTFGTPRLHGQGPTRGIQQSHKHRNEVPAAAAVATTRDKKK